MTEAPAPAPAPAPASAFGPGTLARKLLLRVLALVAAAAVLLSLLTTLAVRELLVGQVDQQLNAAIDRVRRDRYDGPGGSDGPDGRGPSGGLLEPGQPIGTLYAAYRSDGSVVSNGRLAERGQRPLLPTIAVEQLREVPVGGQHTSVNLYGVGRYRLVAYPATIRENGTAQDGTLVVGLPLTQVDRLLAQLVGLEVLLTLLALVGAGLAARAVVARSLRPLNRVAATAQQVSQLELDRGEVALAVRVPPADADPASEVGRVGQAFNHMLNNVEEALAARQASETKVRQFVADASHELRNPLAAIRGYAELTRRSREQMPSDAAYAMSRVESEADRMSHLVEDLLLLARLDSGPYLDLKPVDLAEVVVNAVSDARAAGPDHVWRLSVPDEPVMALADRHRLHQVVANLLANARTHTPPGTVVETGVSVAPGEAVITVTDNGPGIPTDIQPRVFERFTRADVSRVRTPGAAAGASTGLGLAIVAAVVEAHHGRVMVSSVPGQTRFTATVPLVPDEPGAQDAVTP
jgi:two-component system, OmpR family, sensor kinase